MWRKQLALVFPSLLQNKIHLSRISPLPFSSSSPSADCPLEAAPLKSRSLVRLRGVDTLPLVQGLLTNDVSHFEQKSSIYTLLLNHQGRVLFDALLHKPPSSTVEEETILVECDSNLRSKLISHLKLFRLKKKVDIEVEDKLSVWVVYDTGHFSGFRINLSSDAGGLSTATSSTVYELSDNCCKPLNKYSSKREDLPVRLLDDNDKAIHFSDPRLPELGWRIYGPSEAKTTQLFPSSSGISVKEGEDGYKALKYTLGVGEGGTEIPIGNSFPLEANGDYLHGISFHKGCYLGQELTARTHHTGVVRKRLMPFKLADGDLEDKVHGDIQLIQSFQIINEKNRPVGKVRGLNGNLGIALFRVEEALAATSLTLNDTLVKVSKPSWWPVEAAKELSKKS